MLSLFANAIAGLGRLFAVIGTNACAMLFYDEPECPKSLLK
ncbi:MAG: cyclic lactone autoinducer peptide [Bacilli bacterium]|nr:cyclic lactone autoinducer peptide [Bacilli bacterium]